MQSTLECCGVNGYQDWAPLKSNWATSIGKYPSQTMEKVPFSCCDIEYFGTCDRFSTDLSQTKIGSQFYAKGCWDRIKELYVGYYRSFIGIRLLGCCMTVMLFLCLRYLATSFKSRYIDLTANDLGYLC